MTPKNVLILKKKKNIPRKYLCAHFSKPQRFRVAPGFTRMKSAQPSGARTPAASSKVDRIEGRLFPAVKLKPFSGGTVAEGWN